MTEQKGSGGGDTWGVRKAMERRETTRWRCTVRVPWTGIYLLRSDTSNWLWNVSSHITAILMSWPAESIVEKIPFSAVDICTCWIDNTCDTSGNKHVERITMERSTGRSPWRYIHICIVKFHKRLCDPFWDSPRRSYRSMNRAAPERTRSNRQIGCGVLLLWISYHSHFWRFGSPFYASPFPFTSCDRM